MAQGWQPLLTLIWKNSPDTTTPLNASNLNNKVSGFIEELDERTRTLDNVKLDINDAGGIVARAEDGAKTSEAYAIGTRSGIPVTSDDPAYHNNSKYYSEQVGDEALKAEGYANGKQNGVPVGSSSPYYHNNAEYFKDQASQIAAQQLGALTDVDISSPQNGQVLTYDSNENKWVNGASGGTNLDDLNDVSISTPTDGQVLTYDSNAGEWVNANPTGGGDLEDLGDVNITTPTNGQVLKYDSGTQKWINSAESGGGNVPSGSSFVISEYIASYTSTNETIGALLNKTALAVMTQLGNLGNDEYLQVKYIDLGGNTYVPTRCGKRFKKTDTSFYIRCFDCGVASSTEIRMVQIHSTLASCIRRDCTLNSASNTITFADVTNNTTSASCSIYFDKYKIV